MVSLQELKRKFTQNKSICGLSIHLDGSDSFGLQACIIENKKGIIQIIRSDNSFHSLQQVKDWLGDDIPLRISIDGKGIVHKNIEEVGHTDLEELLAIALPNANPEDFWLQSYSSSTHIHLSIARSNIIEQLIREAEKMKLTILDIVLGPFSFSTLIPLLEISDSGIKVRNSYYDIEMYPDGITSFEKSLTNDDWQINIGDENLNQNQIGPYSLAVEEFIPNTSIIQNKEEYLATGRGEWQQKVIFKNLLKIGLAGVFIILLINFLLFNNFKSKNESLSYQVAFNQNNISELRELKKELKEKNKFLNTIGWSGNARLAYYGDRLAMDLPKTIKWQELQIFPLNEQVLRKDKKRIFKNNLITVAGVSDGPVVLNNWINQLEKYEWVRDIQGQEYKYNSKSRKGEFTFEIIIAEI